VTISTADSAARPLRKDAARNRELLIAAAREVFARRGLDASLDDIAREAGVGVGTAYRHFANKYELAQAIMQQAIDAVVERVEQAAQAADPWQALVSFVEYVVELQIGDRALREVMLGMHEHKNHDDINARMTPPISTLLERAKAQGSIRPDVVASDLGMVMMMSGLVADLAREAAPQTWRRYLPSLLNIFTEGGADTSVEPMTDPQFQQAAGSVHWVCEPRPD
jgi:AcrR family transcriptional regulator